MRKASGGRSGFTLLEVIVALAILGTITVLTASAIRNAVNSREKMSGTMSREAAVRDALRVIERDVNAAFHYRDVSPETVRPDQQQAGAPGQVAPPPPPPPTSGVPGQPGAPPPNLTQFLGEKERLDFTALSHVRTIQDAPESDQAEVGYYLAPCRSRSAKRTESSCLWRRESLEIDDDVAKGGDAVVVIENVESLRFRYLGPKKEEWQDAWKTDRSGDDVTRDNFPYAVEIKIRVHDKSDPAAKPVAMTMVAEVRFPNNAPPRRPEQGTPGQTGPNGAAPPPPPPPPSR